MRDFDRRAASWGMLGLATLFVIVTNGAAADPPRTRTFLFTYVATVSGVSADQTARIWLPVPSSNEDQQVQLETSDLPAKPQRGAEPIYGNEVLYLEAKPNQGGAIALSLTYRVTRQEVTGPRRSQAEKADKLDRLLHADARVPIDGKPLDLLKGKEIPADHLAAARLMYDTVFGHMKYSKDRPGWGRGDSIWACESGFGNCSDFHSLFISLARSQKIPAKFEIGFGLPEKRGKGELTGYHCWAKFYVEGKGWVPVDISEASKNPKLRDYYFGNLTEDRVAFSTGRDLTLVPRQDGEPLNFFIYPYVEVAGKVLPADKIKTRFAYEDVAAKP
jgi:transglutaminase-like putative cysteine protease